ncbi:MAG: hypothetical protein QOI57_1144 [Rubrobacteraceae bacterium]|jgi:DNA-binding NarL/FixJ family response regulator|nr:hypothetical protein [Rubrobacteraceae bacterium]
MNNVMLVEDHAFFRQAIAFLLDREEGFGVIVQAGTLAEARRLLNKDVGVAVVDLTLPDGSGIEFIEDLRNLNPESIVLILTASIDPEEGGQAVQAGAAKVLHKSAGIVEIVEVMKKLTAGQ